MPLIKSKSKEAFSKNIAAEIKAGKPPKQAAAIAYSVKREAQKMKDGGKPGLWANIHAKQERIKHGSGERMRKPGSEGAPTAADFKAAAGTAKLAKGGEPRLSVSRGEKLPTSQGAGLTQKGRDKYNRATGSNLKAPQAKGPRHDSFCARMSGMPGPMKDDKGRPTRKAASLKRWHCADGGSLTSAKKTGRW